MQEKVHSEAEMIETFQQGEYFKNHLLFSKEEVTLQLLFYFDGFEVVSDLSSKSGSHHMGNFYSLYVVYSIFIFLSQESDSGAIYWTNSHPLKSLQCSKCLVDS